MTISSPAKINLTLHILGKRPDGFHELETLMAPVSWGDELTIDLADSPGIELSCSLPDLPCDAANLAHRAAAALLAAAGRTGAGVRIYIEKRIPIGAGLGGGSSNAAAVLLALRELLGLSLSDQRLGEIGASLGSDVPFFIHNRPAWCRGRGEIVETASLGGPYHGLLVHPGFGVSTPWAYRTYAAAPAQGLTGKPLAHDPSVRLRNDLEPAVFSKYLWIPAVKRWFQRQPEVHDSLMSGSGSSVFALLAPACAESPAQAAAALAGLKTRFAAEFGENLFAQPIRLAT